MSQEVTKLEFEVAAIRGNAQNAFDKCIRILGLHIGLGNQWVEPASKVCAEVILALVAPSRGVRKIHVVVAGNDGPGKKVTAT